MNCIDVSEWNGNIDWKKAKEDGIEFAMIRCGFGYHGIDKYYNINLEGAATAGITIGVYYYAYATDYDSAVSEAKHCIELIEDYKDIIKLPVFYDVEEPCNVNRIVDVCMGFINTMNYYGYNCGCYCTTSWYNAYFRDIATDYIWLAYLGDTKPEYCDIWQNDYHGSVDGVIGDVDTDIVYNKDMKLLINEPDPKPQPDIKTITFNGNVTITECNGDITIIIKKGD